MSKEEINYEECPPEYGSIFNCAISFVKGIVFPENEKGRQVIILEMLEYGKRLHSSEEKRKKYENPLCHERRQDG